MSGSKKDKVGYIAGGSIVQCPFFHDQEARRIHCESVEIGVAMHLVFLSGEDKCEYCRRYCGSKYEKCKYYQLNDTVYDDFGGRL